MKKYILLFLFAILMLLKSQGQTQCVSNFTFVINQTTRVVTFTNTSTGTNLLYQWNFGDGTYSGLQNPVKTYNTYGTKTVCLTIFKSDSSCSNTKCSTITLSNPCNATWTRFADSANKLKINFTGLNTSNDYTFKWTFGDGGTSDLRTVSHTYAHSGAYKVCLIVQKKDSTCANYICDSIYVYDNTPCINTWTSRPDSLNHLLTYFNPTSTSGDFNYKWTFGDGGSSDLRTPTHTYLKSGKYKVCFTIVKKDSSCSNSFCDSITVPDNNTPPPCNANWTKNVDSTNKMKMNFMALNTSNDFTFNWNFGDGTANSDLRNPAHIYAHAGGYKVCLIVKKKDSTCINYFCDSIHIYDNPVPCIATWGSHPDSLNHLLTYFTPASTGTDFNYYWSFGDGTTSTLRTPTHTYLHAGRYKVCFNVSKKDTSCSVYLCDSITVPDNNIPPVPCVATWNYHNDSANHSIIYFNATNTSSDFYYKWSFGDATSSDLRTPIHTYLKPGKYKVCLTVIKKDSSCYNYVCDSITVPDNNVPVPCVATWNSHPDSVNHLITYFNTPITSNDFIFKWYFGDNTSSDLRAPAHTYAHAGRYKVCFIISKKDSSCANYICDSITVPDNNVNTPCNANWNMKPDSANHLKMYFSSVSTSNDFNYRWTFGDGMSSDSKTPSHIFAKAGKYRVCLKVTKKDSTCSMEHCDSVYVAANTGCEAAFTFSATNREVHFTNTSGGSYNKVKWIFGDTTYSDLSNPVHTYNHNGTFTVCLYIFRIENGDTLCANGKCSTIVVTTANTSCSASFTKTINTSNRKVEFTSTSTGNHLVYFWTFGDDTVSLSTNPAHIYAHNGTYRVCLYIVNSQDTTCRSSHCEYVTVVKDTIAVQGHVSAGFQFEAYDPSANSVQFTNTSIGSNLTYNWSFGDGESSDQANPLHSYSNKDWYLVCLQITDNNTNDIICQNVYPDNVSTGIQHMDPIANVTKVFPNPFKDHLTIEINSKQISHSQFSVTDITGKTVLEKNVKLMEGDNHIVLETTTLDNGFYFVRVNGSGLNLKFKVIK